MRVESSRGDTGVLFGLAGAGGRGGFDGSALCP